MMSFDYEETELSSVTPSISSLSTYGPGQFSIASIPARINRGVQKNNSSAPELTIKGRAPARTKSSPPSFPRFLTLNAPANPMKGLAAHVRRNISASREMAKPGWLAEPEEKATRKNAHNK